MLRHFLFRFLLVSGKLLACRVRVRHAGQLGGGHTKRGLPETNGSDDNAALPDAGGRYLSRGRATHYLRGRKASLKVIQKRLLLQEPQAAEYQYQLRVEFRQAGQLIQLGGAC